MKRITLTAVILLAGFAVNAGADDLDINPNPARDEMNVEIPDSFLGLTDISIEDTSGKIIYQAERFLDAYDSREELVPVVDLPGGAYLLLITNCDKEVESKFTKQ